MTSGSKDDVKSDHAVAGGVSGFVTRLLFQPLDVVKIRFQVKYSIFNFKFDNKHVNL